jgi:hypothetical protein
MLICLMNVSKSGVAARNKPVETGIVKMGARFSEFAKRSSQNGAKSQHNNVITGKILRKLPDTLSRAVLRLPISYYVDSLITQHVLFAF